jgi:hypothetical protein
MATIPQITREQLLKSSVVGVPGVNPLPEAAGKAFGAGLEASAGAGFDIAMKLQTERNQGEFASLMLDHSTNIMAAAEQIKKQDADHPDDMSKDLSVAMGKSLEVESARASNPFVKLMVQQGDPAAQMWALRQINLDAADQGWRNTLKHAINTGNDYANKAMEIGGDLSLSPTDMMQRIAPLIHGAGLLKTSIDNSLHSEQADGIYNGVVKGIMKGVIDPTLSSQPWKTSELLANPGVSKYFTPDEMKAYQKQADDAVHAWPAKMQTEMIQKDLAQYPDVVNDVMSGKAGFAAIDSKQRMDPDPSHAPFYNYLKDISLNVTSVSGNNMADKESIKSKLIDDAVQIGLKLPGQFATVGDEKGFMAPKIDTNIQKLYNFRDELTSALARKIISPGEFNTYFKQLAVPLTAATLKNHDPNWFDAQVHGSQLNPDGSIKKQGWLATSDPTKVDDFRGAYDIIERALKLHQMDEKSPEYLAAKSDSYDAYFKALDRVKPGQLNALGRPYSPIDVAHAVMGEALGQEIMVKGVSMGRVAGYDPKDGMPIIDTEKEWQDRVSNEKNLKSIR